MRRMSLLVAAGLTIAVSSCGDPGSSNGSPADSSHATVEVSQPDGSTTSSSPTSTTPAASTSTEIGTDSPVVETGYSIGDVADPNEEAPTPEDAPKWVAVSDASGVVVGYVLSDDLFMVPAADDTTVRPVVVYDESGVTAIGTLGADGPTLDADQS